ncbi:iron-containing alcohol dehydrogenase [Candidatus Poribacteria bacterium]|nr:iron-containing alcohol dehydrogenase [Candidatus Poribacteria bacterium]
MTNTLGKYIGEAIDKSPLKRKDIANKCGMEVSFLSKIRTDNAIPSEEKLEALVEVLNLDKKKAFDLRKGLKLTKKVERGKKNLENSLSKLELLEPDAFRFNQIEIRPNGYVGEYEQNGAFIFDVKAIHTIQYQNHFVHDIFGVDETLASLCKNRMTLVLLDEALSKDYEKFVKEYFDKHKINYELHLCKAGEHNKNMDSVFEIINYAINFKLDRAAAMVAIGGGSLNDISGFASSIYRRGVRFIRVPTTLLSLVDAAVGIKVGVNLGHYKNLLGAFYPPYAIVSDIGFLKTLDQRQIKSGLGEMLKMALASNPHHLFEDIYKFGDKLIRNEDFPEKEAMIKKAVYSEISILQKDLTEQNLQREIDLGHTFAHFLEGLSDYSLLHGEAVVIDLLLTSHIAKQKDKLPEKVLGQITELVKLLGFPVYHECITMENLWPAAKDAAIAHKGGKLIMVLPEDNIGKVTFSDELSEHEMANAIQYLASISGEVGFSVLEPPSISAQWLIDRVKIIKPDLVIEPEIQQEITKEYSQGKIAKEAHKYYQPQPSVKGRIYQEANLIYSAIPSLDKDNENVPVEVHEDLEAKTQMANVRQKFNQNNLSLVKNDYWKKLASYRGNLRYFNDPFLKDKIETSIIIPTLNNRFQLLKNRINELAYVENDGFELIIVLADPDGMTQAMRDDLYKTLKDAPFPAMVAESLDNTICRNRNIGASIANGEYLIFLDDDVRLVGPAINEMVKSLEKNPAMGLVSIPSYNLDQNLHRPGSYHLKHYNGNNTVIVNRIAGMVMATRRKVCQVAPFPKFWPNFSEDIQFSKQIHKLGFCNAYIYPLNAYAMHEHVTGRATESPLTLRNVILHEGITYYLEAEGYDEISEVMSIKRLCAYDKQNPGINLAREFFVDFREKVHSFLDYDEKPLREMSHEWFKGRPGLILDVVKYLEAHKEQIIEYKKDYNNLSEVNPNLGFLRIKKRV